MEEEETRRQGVPLGRRFHALQWNSMTTNDERFYEKYDKFRADCRNMTNMA